MRIPFYFGDISFTRPARWQHGRTEYARYVTVGWVTLFVWTKRGRTE